MNYINKMLACRESFVYFCQHIKIVHPVKGLIQFEPHRYQLRLADHCDKHACTILTKYRQGGFTTLMMIYSLWKALFNDDTHVFIGESTSRMALHTKHIFNRITLHLPDYMKAMIKMSGCNTTEFYNGSSVVMSGIKNARGRQVDYMILDEPAFVKNMSEHWASIFPCLKQDGKVIALSTTNGADSWFFETYQNAKMGLNFFKIFDTSYTDCPIYTEEFLDQIKKQLTEESFQQEILGNFILT